MLALPKLAASIKPDYPLSNGTACMSYRFQIVERGRPMWYPESNIGLILSSMDIHQFGLLEYVLLQLPVYPRLYIQFNWTPITLQYCVIRLNKL